MLMKKILVLLATVAAFCIPVSSAYAQNCANLTYGLDIGFQTVYAQATSTCYNVNSNDNLMTQTYQIEAKNCSTCSYHAWHSLVSYDHAWMTLAPPAMQNATINNYGAAQYCGFLSDRGYTFHMLIKTYLGGYALPKMLYTYSTTPYQYPPNGSYCKLDSNGNPV
jgi:hypothetical protein